jgi:hypothetical protein
VTEEERETIRVVTVKDADVEPPGTVTVVDTLATPVSPLVSCTAAPPEGAVEVKVTVPCTDMPPMTLAWFTAMDASVGSGGGGGTVIVSPAFLLVPPKEAEMVVPVEDVTAEEVVTVKSARVVPAGTVTLAGTEATEVLELDSSARAPPAGAAADSPTVPCDELPRVTLFGFKDNEVRDTAGKDDLFRVNVAVLMTDPYEAATVTELLDWTADVVMLKVAPLVPPATITFAGTVASVAFEVQSATVIPPEGADDVSVIVPWEDAPPVTVVGLTLTPERLTAGGGAGLTVSAAVLLVPIYDAEIVTDREVETDEVETAKVALVEPPAMVMLLGTDAEPGLELERDTTAPPVGAADVNATVPCEESPPVRVVGFNDSDDKFETGGGAGGITANEALLPAPP